MFDREKLRNVIQERGLKQKAVAKEAEILPETFSLILTGKRKCGLEEYIRICKALGVPMSTFIME